MKKISLIIFITCILSINAMAGSSGDTTLSKKQSGPVKDCFEGVNRGIFAFNQALDSALFKPLAKGYRQLPVPVKMGTSNVLDNLGNLITVPNNILQGQILYAGVNSLRFIINTTIGILGIFDPAASFGLDKKDKEDYGQTLATWGMGPGCYIVLPILGPSTARDAVGSLVSFAGGDPWYNITVINDTRYVTDFDYYLSRATSGIDFRAKNIDSLDNLEKNSMDFYASIKSLYVQDRQQKILNSKKIIHGQDDSDWEEIENN